MGGFKSGSLRWVSKSMSDDAACLNLYFFAHLESLLRLGGGGDSASEL